MRTALTFLNIMFLVMVFCVMGLAQIVIAALCLMRMGRL